MAKIYSPQGIIRGTYGNLTYVYYDGMNIVRTRKLTNNDPLTSKQLFSRARYCSTLKMYQTLKNFLTNCFEKTKETDNKRNSFFKLNNGSALPYNKELFKDSYVAPIGDFYCSHGTLGFLEYVKNSEGSYSGVKLNNIQNINPPVSDFSTNIISRYPWVREGDTFRMFGVLYTDLFSNTGEDRFTNPFTKGNHQRLRVTSAELVIDTHNNTEYINSFGLICLNPGIVSLTVSSSDIVVFPAHEAGTAHGVGYFGAVIIRKSGEVYHSSTNTVCGNESFDMIKTTMSDPKYYDYILEDWRKYYRRKGKKVSKD